MDGCEYLILKGQGQAASVKDLSVQVPTTFAPLPALVLQYKFVAQMDPPPQQADTSASGSQGKSGVESPLHL